MRAPRILIVGFLLFSGFAQAEPLQSRFGHLYWGLGPNLSPMGNVRIGVGAVEFGLIQGSGVGLMGVHRTQSPLFIQLGVLSTSGGAGIIGGGGLEWNTSSWFRWRGDITVSTDGALQTESFVSFGGVFIL